MGLKLAALHTSCQSIIARSHSRSKTGVNALMATKQSRLRRRLDCFARNDGEAYAAFCFAVISLRLIRHSAIWMVLSAAPLRRLSETIHIESPFSTVASSRMRLI